MQRGVLLPAFVILSAACTRYEWKPDYLVPEICPPAKRIAAAPRVDSEVTLEQSSLHGRVIRTDTALAIGGAKVELLSPRFASTSTDSAGRFQFAFVAPGRYVVRVRSIGYRPWQDTVKVVLVARPELTIRLVADMMDGPCSGFESVRVRKPWWKFW